MLYEAKPTNLSIASARLLLAGKKVKTLAQVGSEFELAPMTIRSNWRRDGMPGKPGSFDIAEILVWRLAHDAKFSGNKGSTKAIDRKEEAAELELQKLRIDVGRRQREEAYAEGQLIHRDDALAAGKAAISVAIARVESAAGEIETLLPVKIAKAVVAENKRNVCRPLKALSEAYPGDIIKEAAKRKDA